MAENLAWSLPEDLAELLREDPETMQSILATFVEQTRLNLLRVEELAAADDGAELSRAVHRMKGGLAQMGAGLAADLCKQFEVAIPNETREQWQRRTGELRTACETVLLLAGKLLQGLG